MIIGVYAKNFKNLKDINELEIKPITLLVGANGSGKTNILQSLLLIKQTVENDYLISPLVLRGSLINLGSFKDIISDHDISKNLTIRVTMDTGYLYEKYPKTRIFPYYLYSFLKRKLKNKLLDKISFEFTVAYNKTKATMKLLKNQVFDGEKNTLT